MKKQNQYPVATEDLWQIIENLHDEIMVYDNDYHLVFVNKAAERHYGKTAEELIGTHFSQLDETYWGNSTLPEVYEKKKMVAKRQITNLGLDIITISVPIFDEQGNIKYVAQNVNDIYNYNKMGKAEEAFLEITDGTEPREESFLYASENMKSVMETIEKIQPTVWNQFNNWGVRLFPVALTVVILALGIYLFRRNSKRFAEVM